MGSVGKKIAVILVLMRQEIEKQIEIWGDQINNHDGWLKPYLKARLTICHDSCDKLLEFYKLERKQINNSLVERVANEMTMNYNKQYKKQSQKVVILEVEEKTLPAGMFESYLKWCICIESLNDKYILDLERRGIIDEFKKLNSAFKAYHDFFEKELIITV